MTSEAKPIPRPALPTFAPIPDLSFLPGPGRLSIFAWYRLIRDNAGAIFPARAFEEDLVETKFLWSRSFIIGHPDGVRRVLRDNVANYPKSDTNDRIVKPMTGEGLLVADGDIWRRHRRIIAPSFEPRGVGRYLPAIVAAANEEGDAWARVPPGEAIDVLASMVAITSRVILRALFSSSSEPAGLADGIARYQAGTLPNLLDLARCPERWAGWRRRRLARRQVGPIDRIIEVIIRERRAAGVAGEDLLGRMLASGELNLEEIRDEMMTVFFAGFETTAVALAWSWYLLSLHPEAAARFGEELRSVLNGRPPTAEDLPKLEYVSGVFEETLRLYPPIYSIAARRARADDEVCGRRIPAGSRVLIMPWILHRHRRLWKEPDRFDPDRFSEARSKERPRYAYIPFGAGPRSCLAASFATTEALAVLATLGQRFRLKCIPEEPIELRGMLTLRTRRAIRMRLEPIR